VLGASVNQAGISLTGVAGGLAGVLGASVNQAGISLAGIAGGLAGVLGASVNHAGMSLAGVADGVLAGVLGASVNHAGISLAGVADGVLAGVLGASVNHAGMSLAGIAGGLAGMAGSLLNHGGRSAALARSEAVDGGWDATGGSGAASCSQVGKSLTGLEAMAGGSVDKSTVFAPVGDCGSGEPCKVRNQSGTGPSSSSSLSAAGLAEAGVGVFNQAGPSSSALVTAWNQPVVEGALLGSASKVNGVIFDRSSSSEASGCACSGDLVEAVDSVVPRSQSNVSPASRRVVGVVELGGALIESGSVGSGRSQSGKSVAGCAGDGLAGSLMWDGGTCSLVGVCASDTGDSLSQSGKSVAGVAWDAIGGSARNQSGTAFVAVDGAD
jgi:hypothetical protein